MSTVWETLSNIDVNDKTEKKNGLTYLSWAWAWGVLKKHYPSATFEKHIQPNGMPYILDANGYAYVQVTVTVEDISSTELFPVLDYRNKAIQNPDAFQVNTAMQRALAKAISYHGLGHYIYAGEDLPESHGETRREPVENEANQVVKKSEPQPTASPSASESNLGYVVNTFAYRPQDKEPRAFSDWDAWVSIMCAWIDTAKTENQLNVFYNKNKKSFDLANYDALSKYEEVIAKLSAKKAEVQKGK
jgi:hypothetical protein